MAIAKVVCTNLINNPSCPHGPTLKFVRVKKGSVEEFFACSTFRDRKDCSFYVPVNELKLQQHQDIWAVEKRRVLPSIDLFALRDRLCEVKEVSPKDRIYCHTCSQLDILSRKSQHGGHSVQTVITDHMLNHPSEILKPKEGPKKEAQYLFAATTTQVIVDNLQRAEVTHVLCLGTPRIHEYIQEAANMDSLLLDLDPRYHSFWFADKFVWYNMFNRHMMLEDPKLARRAVRRFLAAARQVALVLDPPFGGHVEPLAATIRHFTKLVARRCQHTELRVIWIFPYFRERHILEKCPTLKMLDYKVQYENHKEFNNGAKGRKLGSPVRLFTNMEPRKFVLPKAEGYHLCKTCGRWVSPENKHCAKCNSCPSKDGRTYIHCDLCKSCVKPQWQHCHTCQKCLPPSHICMENGEEENNQESKQPRHKKLKSSK